MMKEHKMIYKDYLKRISHRFSDRFNEIDPEWNFDIGNEFEIELAILFDELLPDKYGICRGFVTPEKGEAKGDDIIIYDRLSAPLLRPTNLHKFTKKEYVPLEATYAYIEAKNTLELKDETKGTYIMNAVKQTKDVKRLPREPRNVNELIKGLKFDESNIKNPQYTLNGENHRRDYLNPLYTVVFARGARINGKLVKDYQEIRTCLNKLELGDDPPDLIVIGEDLVFFPVIDDSSEPNNPSMVYELPFLRNNTHVLVMSAMPKAAYGFGLASIIYALQEIKLKGINWRNVLKDGVKYSNDYLDKS